MAREFVRFEDRPAQRAMAQAVARALDGQGRLVVEAGTGTGKTLAYLLPAILWAKKNGQRVVISTATRALQDQLMQSDIPLAEKILGEPARAYLLKGRTNYLCKRRLAAFNAEPLFASRRDIDLFQDLLAWSEVSERGERSELAGLADESGLWNQVNSTSEECLGAKCPLYRESFTTLLKQNALDSDILVVNHHLFFADLLLRERAKLGVLPDYGAIIFDEAHALEEIATQFLGCSVASGKILNFSADVARVARKNSGLAALAVLAAALEGQAREFFTALDAGNAGELTAEAGAKGADLLQGFKNLKTELDKLDTIEAIPLQRRVDNLAHDLEFWLGRELKHFVYWMERPERGQWLLKAAPSSVAADFRERLFDSQTAMVFSSATLSVRGGLDFFCQSLGIDEAEKIALPSEFDFQKRSRLYIPKDMPLPQSEEFRPSVIAQIEKILQASRGRALLLFTSLRLMREAYKALHSRLPYPLLLQGEAPKGMLMKKFREDVDSVLFASQSFWEGLDVPGESLSCVVIDKLPFLAPDDPLTAARTASLEAQGRDPFWNLQIPKAVLSLKQGIGRLLRHREDRGVVAILDSRLWRKSYGRALREELSFMPVTAEFKDVEAFFKEENKA